MFDFLLNLYNILKIRITPMTPVEATAKIFNSVTATLSFIEEAFIL